MKTESIRNDAAYMDKLSSGDTPVHRLDARAKVLVTIAFVIAVLSFGKYEISALVSFLVFPAFMIFYGRMPAIYFLRKIAIISPLVIFIAIFNPVFDRRTVLVIGSLSISAGWFSFVSILIKFLLTAVSVLVLFAGTGFHEICLALEKMGVPGEFVTQLNFLYRYLFVLMDEAARMNRSCSLRSFGKRRMKIPTVVSLLGNLLLRTMDRAERLHRAMLARGFKGRISLIRDMNFGLADGVYTVFWVSLFVLMRLWNLPGLIGRVTLELIQ
ncbi:MAG: cobalt ECF transporter T component CbiQ [Candidatus Krumholzibacteriales bacterium]